MAYDMQIFHRHDPLHGKLGSLLDWGYETVSTPPSPKFSDTFVYFSVGTRHKNCVLGS